MRKLAKTDENQQEIIDQLKSLPYRLSMIATHQLGGGFPDLVIGYKGRNLLVEIKNPEWATRTELVDPFEMLTEDEESFLMQWEGEYIIAFDIDPILDWIAGVNHGA